MVNKAINGLVLLCLLLPGVARAQVTFTYTGHAFASADSRDGTAAHLTIRFTTSLSVDQLINYSGDLTASVTSYEVSDHVKVSIAQSTPSAAFFAHMNTDGNGNPVSWTVFATGANSSGALRACSNTIASGRCFNSGVPQRYDTAEVVDDRGGVSGRGSIVFGNSRDGVGAWTVVSGPAANVRETITTVDASVVAATPQLLTLSAPVAYFSVGSLGFGGQGGNMPLTVSNLGNANLALVNAQPAGDFILQQIACTNGAAALPTSLPPGGACVLTVNCQQIPGAPPGAMVFTDNAAFSNFSSTAAAPNYTQSVPLDGSGTSTTPPPLPSTAVSVPVSETIATLDAAVVAVTPQLLSINEPVAVFSYSSLDFGNQSGTMSFTVSNLGQATLTLASASFPSSPFTVTRIACTGGASSLPTSLGPGAACQFTVSYNSPGFGPPPTDSFVLTDNAAFSNLPNTALGGGNFTQTVPLAGAGTSTVGPPPPATTASIPWSETITAVDNPVIAVTPPLTGVTVPVAYYSVGSLGFGGQTGILPVTLSNLGTANLTLISATPSGSGAFSIFSIACTSGAGALPTTLPPGGACVVSVDYNAGAPSGTIAFADNAPLSNLANAGSGSNFTQMLALSGAGTSTAPSPVATAVSSPVNESITAVDVLRILIPATNNACDVNQDSHTNAGDISAMIGQALGTSTPSNPLAGGGTVSVVDIQIVIDAVRGMGCWGR